jgi:hypothetical protein
LASVSHYFDAQRVYAFESWWRRPRNVVMMMVMMMMMNGSAARWWGAGRAGGRRGTGCRLLQRLLKKYDATFESTMMLLSKAPKWVVLSAKALDSHLIASYKRKVL